MMRPAESAGPRAFALPSPVFAFVIYAVAVWYAAARWRRTWSGFLWVSAGGLGLVLVALFHYQLNIWTDGRIYLRVMQVLLYPYAILVVGMGLYIACLPRAVVLPPRRCPACRYDLRGLDPDDLRCPECGMPYDYAVARQIRGIHSGIAEDPPPEPLPRILPNPLIRERASTRRRPEGPGPAAPRWPPT